MYRDICPKLPNEEKFGLNTQIKRCTVSIEANITEGSSRSTDTELRQFLYTALASASELDCFIELLKDLNYIPSSIYSSLIKDTHSLQKQINSFILKLNTTIKS